MNLELSDTERDLLRKIVETYRSDLRHTIAATQRGTGDLHAEEDQLDRLLEKLGRGG